MRQPLLHLFFLLLYGLPMAAQQYAFRNISTDEGLPTSECYDLMQDHKGYIWVSSNAGIGRYNGKTFRTFTTKDGLADNTVFKTFEDEQGRIFYIGANARIGYIMNDSVYNTPVSDTLSRLLSMGRQFIYTISNYDAAHLLISTQSGFYLLDKKTLSRLHYIASPPNAHVRIWVSDGKAYAGCYLCMDKSYTGERTICVRQNNKETCISSRIGKLNAGVFRAVQLADSSTLLSSGNTLIHIRRDGSYETREFPAMIISLEKDQKNGLWISMLNNGTCYYPRFPEQGLNDTTTQQHLMKGESPSDVLMDKDGGIWISTLYNGLYYCPNLGIINYSNVDRLNARLYGLSHIRSNVLANGLNNRLFIFSDKNTYRYVDITKDKMINGALSYFAYNNKIYAAGYNSSYILDTNFGLHPFLYKDGATALYNIAADKDGHMFAMHFSRMFRIEKDTIYNLMVLPSRGRDIAASSSGLVYVAFSNGVSVYENDTLEKTAVAVKVNKLRPGPGGTMWACTDGRGIIQLRGKAAIKSYTEADGLPSGICYDILSGGGSYWVATNKGLCCLDTLAPAKSYTLQKENGLPSNEILKLAEMNGELYMSTSKGLCVADFRSLHPDNTAPPIYLSSVLCNDSAAGSSNDFRYDHNNFMFTVEGLSFRNVNDMYYMYRLQGHDSSWNTGSSGEINYNNLPPGSYTFEAKAVNANGISSRFPARYSFMIEKPFWRRTWFLFILAFVLIECIYLLVRWRVHVVKKREARRTEYNKALAEYHMSALRAQMNPHFVFNAINSIQHYILSNEKQQAYNYLTKFSRLIRQVLSNSQQNTSSLKKELELLELYIQIEQQRFRNRFEFEIRHSDDFPAEEIEIPIMLLQPYVENAIWHGIMNLPETQKGRLLVSLEMADDTVKITIEDNGVGREKAAAMKKDNTHEPVGMRLSQDRLEILKMLGRSDATIRVTDLFNAQGPAGTRVEIFIK